MPKQTAKGWRLVDDCCLVNGEIITPYFIDIFYKYRSIHGGAFRNAYTLWHLIDLLELCSMAVVRAGEASSSSTSPCAYHVFLSFRGEDTRKTFTDHLYTALVQAGFRTFRDDEGIERGENIKSELQNAIQQSRSSTIVLSKDFASSKWCLDELVMILEWRRRMTSRFVVIPVFYDIDPSQVRNQTGKIAKALAGHEEQFKKETDQTKNHEWMDKMSRWRAALREVADFGGMVLRNQADGHESKFIQKIVKVIKDKLNRTVLSVAPHLIGINSRTKNINSWLRDGSADVGIVAICGVGGIGKTTIAKYVYNLNFGRFEGCSFLANIREISKQDNGLVRLQRQLLYDILRGKKEKISNVDEGIVKIKDAICCKRILLVMDDVDREEQLDAILGMRDWLYPRSKVIITTRNGQLLKPHQVHKMEVKVLDNNESLELLSLHAFGQDHPIEGYMEHSKRVVNRCRGLPLALKVVGSSLSGKSADVWESQLQKLEAIPDNKIQETLRISYDSLQDDHDKNLFLHIACFFVGEDKDFIVTVLDSCDFYTIVGIDNLIDRCLLTIDEYNKKLRMHQLIQDMGREIVRQESPNEPGKRSRLWHHMDSFSVLSEKTGTETIEGLVLNTHMSMRITFGVNDANERRFKEYLDESLLNPEVTAVRNSNEVVLETDAFARMHKLRLLQLSYVRLARSYKDFPKRLRWLCWHGFPLESIPNNFPLESLVVLDMQYSKLKFFWQGTKFLGLLKIIDLSHSHSLARTPDFSVFPNLERLILEDCTSLIQVHESIGNLYRLVVLNLKDCENLKTLPRNIGMLKFLETLVISGCSNLDGPLELKKMESLKVLDADGIAVNRVFCTTEEVKPWHAFVWSWVSKPRRSPEISWASLPCSLVSLSLRDCNLRDDDFPKDLSKLSLLQNLDLGKNPICGLPDCFKGLNRLQLLKLGWCTKLQSLVGLPCLDVLEVRCCTSLEKITYRTPLIRPCISHHDCNKLVEVQNWFKLEPIGKVDTEMINTLGLFNLESMENVDVNFFDGIIYDERKLPIQGLYENGIFSTFVPGGEVPAGCFNKKSSGSSISFTVPSLPNLRIRGLNVCCVYALSNNQHDWQPPPLFTKVSNKTKGLKWIYGPRFFGIPEDGKDMMWLSHWNFGNKLEGGDEVNVSIVVDGSFQVKESGIKLVYKQEQIIGRTQDEAACSSWPYGIGGDSSLYEDEESKGTYYSGIPGHHRSQTNEGSLRDGDCTRTEWYKNLFEESVQATGQEEEEELVKIQKQKKRMRIS